MTKCTSKTAKGLACKNEAVGGSTKCRVHSKKTAGAKTVKKVRFAVKKVPKKTGVTKKSASKLSKLAQEIEEHVKEGYTVSDSSKHYLNLEKSGKLPTVKQQIFQKLKKLEGVGSSSIEDVEINKTGSTIRFVINKEGYGRVDDEDFKKVDKVVASIMKIIKTVPSAKIKLSGYDEENYRWKGKIRWS